MLLSAVLVVALPSSEIPEELMNYPVLTIVSDRLCKRVFEGALTLLEAQNGDWLESQTLSRPAALCCFKNKYLKLTASNWSLTMRQTTLLVVQPAFPLKLGRFSTLQANVHKGFSEVLPPRPLLIKKWRGTNNCLQI
jgi:hypothetical protein